MPAKQPKKATAAEVAEVAEVVDDPGPEVEAETVETPEGEPDVEVVSPSDEEVVAEEVEVEVILPEGLEDPEPGDALQVDPDGKVVAVIKPGTGRELPEGHTLVMYDG